MKRLVCGRVARGVGNVVDAWQRRGEDERRRRNARQPENHALEQRRKFVGGDPALGASSKAASEGCALSVLLGSATQGAGIEANWGNPSH